MADRNKKTIYIGGLPQDADESTLLSTFSVFGDVVEVQIQEKAHGQMGKVSGMAGLCSLVRFASTLRPDSRLPPHRRRQGSHRGFGFVIFSAADEAEDAIDNMHLNELNGVSGRNVALGTA